MESLEIFGFEISFLIYLPVLYFCLVAVLFLSKKLFFVKARKFAHKKASKFDNIVLGSLSFPLTLIIFASGVFVLDRLFSFGDNHVLGYLNGIVKLISIFAVILFFDRFLRNLLEHYSEQKTVIRQSKGVVRVIMHVLVFGVGFLVLLDSFGISITPIMASLGIGSLAVALALQPTLENFFSGVQIVMDKPITVGQFVQLDSGEEGYVEKIGWRSTWVRMLANNVVVIPNKILVNSKLLNYDYPGKELAVRLQVGVHYDSDLEHVEDVTIDVAKKTLLEVQGGVHGFTPFIRYHTFDSSSINFTVIMRGKEFIDSYLIKHEFIKRLHGRYREENINIPYPLVTLDWNDGSNPLRLKND